MNVADQMLEPRDSDGLFRVGRARPDQLVKVRELFHREATRLCVGHRLDLAVLQTPKRISVMPVGVGVILETYGKVIAVANNIRPRRDEHKELTLPCGLTPAAAKRRPEGRQLRVLRCREERLYDLGPGVGRHLLPGYVSGDLV